MYRIEDNRSAVKALQELLGLAPTGNYDKSTRNAVLQKQSDNSLEQTGVADYKTFTVIVNDHRKRMGEIWESNYLHSPSFPYVRGDMGVDESRINDALRTVLIEYSYEDALPRGSYLGDDTFLGVKYLRRIFKMEERDAIDEGLMNRILDELAAIEIKGLSMN